MSRHTTHPTRLIVGGKTAPNRVKIQSRTRVMSRDCRAEQSHYALNSCVPRHSPRGHASRSGAVFLVDSVGGRDIGSHRARFQNLPIHSGTEPVYGWRRRTGTVHVAMLVRPCRSAARCRSILVIAPRRAKDVSRALAVFVRVLTNPPWSTVHPAAARLHDGGDRANPKCDDYMWSLLRSLAPACVLNAPVIVTFSPALLRRSKDWSPRLIKMSNSSPKRRHRTRCCSRAELRALSTCALPPCWAYKSVDVGSRLDGFLRENDHHGSP